MPGAMSFTPRAKRVPCTARTWPSWPWPSVRSGGRFLSETLTRMQEMLSQEAAKPGSSGKWQTEFYYDNPDNGVVVVAVTGEQGLFDVAYQLPTPTQNL